jgi:hypothetical protein
LKGESVADQIFPLDPAEAAARNMQRMNFGRIEALAIEGGEPSFTPPPRIVKDVKLGAADNGARPELDSDDFALKREHIDLFENFRRLGHGTIECLEVKSGLPFRFSTVDERV